MASGYCRNQLAHIDCSNDWSLVGVAWARIQLVGGYFPQRKDKAGVFDTLEIMASSNLLAIGDFNTGSNTLGAEGAKFHCADQFVHLARPHLRQSASALRKRNN